MTLLDHPSPEAAEPFSGLLEVYAQGLALSREYLASLRHEAAEGDVDAAALEHFLQARADLFAVATIGVNGLAAPAGEPADPQRGECLQKIIAVLEEIIAIEDQLTAFLGEHISVMRRTMAQMAQCQPIFKRYSQLGGQNFPNNITRRE